MKGISFLYVMLCEKKKRHLFSLSFFLVQHEQEAEQNSSVPYAS